MGLYNYVPRNLEYINPYIYIYMKYFWTPRLRPHIRGLWLGSYGGFDVQSLENTDSQLLSLTNNITDFLKARQPKLTSSFEMSPLAAP